jgi:formate transporter
MSNILDKKTEKKRYPILDLDAYSPEEVASRVMQVGVKKVRLPGIITLMLGIMGGCFISLGALYQVVVMANPAISDSTSAVVSPLFYAMGYIIAFIAGTEIFTTNNLAVMSLASRKITLWELTRNWSIVLIANMIGASGLVLLFFYSGQIQMFDGLLIEEVLFLTSSKLNYTIFQMFLLGLFGNLLICSGAWLAMAGRSVTDKFLALILPLSAVPAIGFQHGAGNMFHFFLSFLILQDGQGLQLPTDITLLKTTVSLVAVASGNIIGGGVFIALTYYFIYVRSRW